GLLHQGFGLRQSFQCLDRLRITLKMDSLCLFGTELCQVVFLNNLTFDEIQIVVEFCFCIRNLTGAEEPPEVSEQGIIHFQGLIYSCMTGIVTPHKKKERRSTEQQSLKRIKRANRDSHIGVNASTAKHLTTVVRMFDLCRSG